MKRKTIQRILWISAMGLLSASMVQASCPCENGTQQWAGQDACGNNVCDPNDVDKHPYTDACGNSTCDPEMDGEYPYKDACDNGVCDEPDENMECCGEEPYDPATYCCEDGKLIPSYNGTNPCTPENISNYPKMLLGSVSEPSIDKVVVTSYAPYRSVRLILGQGTWTNRTYLRTAVQDGGDHSNSCGGQIPSNIHNVGGFSYSVSGGLNIGIASITIGYTWTQSSNSYPVFDKADAGGESGIWKNGTVFKIYERPNAARYTASGSTEMLQSPYHINPLVYDEEIIYFNNNDELVAYDYRVCTMCCEG